MKEDDIIYIIKLTDEEKHDLWEQGVSYEEIKKKGRYKISRKDYLEMIKKRNERGDTTVCECGHSIIWHEPSLNYLSYPAGRCYGNRNAGCNSNCNGYKEKELDEGSDSNRGVST